jgi:hypothetical protein
MDTEPVTNLSEMSKSVAFGWDHPFKPFSGHKKAKYMPRHAKGELPVFQAMRKQIWW